MPTSSAVQFTEPRLGFGGALKKTLTKALSLARNWASEYWTLILQERLHEILDELLDPTFPVLRRGWPIVSSRDCWSFRSTFPASAQDPFVPAKSARDPRRNSRARGILGVSVTGFCPTANTSRYFLGKWLGSWISCGAHSGGWYIENSISWMDVRLHKFWKSFLIGEFMNELFNSIT